MLYTEKEDLTPGAFCQFERFQIGFLEGMSLLLESVKTDQRKLKTCSRHNKPSVRKLSGLKVKGSYTTENSDIQMVRDNTTCRFSYHILLPVVGTQRE